MKKTMMMSCVALAIAGAPTASRAQLKDENVLLPVPNAFKLGWSKTAPRQMEMSEFVPQGETVDDWSSMITLQTFYGQGGQDPDVLPQKMAEGWRSSCPNSEAGRTARVEENGYPVSLWAMLCPNDPKTKKPENVLIKVISGKDALYVVQYAFRVELTSDLVRPANQVLRAVIVCDTRSSEHPCPTKR